MSTDLPHPWRPKLVALDIDGTIVDHAGLLSDDVRDAIRRVVDAGVPVVLSTGRSWHATLPILKALGLPPGLTVSSNGAVTVSYPPFEVTNVVTFDPSDVIERVLAEHPTASLAAEVVGWGYRVNRYFPDGELHGQMELVSVDDLAAGEVTRIVVRDAESTDGEFIKLAERLGLHGVSYFVGWSAWLDIAPAGVNKATALAAVAASLGVAQADVLAIGDGRNDIEMIAWAGRGVALGDAAEEVARQADHVTGTFAAGGTATELRRWFS
ncbi:MAG TPA: HAD family hydrolase [Propionicimonas sp.]|jgi:Cof subfamily protein (haloacid dehalogenase superfamily)|uniref:HAD family hydrolase n=1 Tax=Propionicimonas sp. TaxID=1955623 RepID=UPI002F41BF65